LHRNDAVAPCCGGDQRLLQYHRPVGPAVANPCRAIGGPMSHLDQFTDIKVHIAVLVGPWCAAVAFAPALPDHHGAAAHRRSGDQLPGQVQPCVGGHRPRGKAHRKHQQKEGATHQLGRHRAAGQNPPQGRVVHRQSPCRVHRPIGIPATLVIHCGGKITQKPVS